MHGDRIVRQVIRLTPDHDHVRHSYPDDARTAAGAPETDATLAGHRVIRLLGTGERAVVYLGHSGAGSAVALKVFRSDTPAAGIELDIAVLTSAAAPGLVRLLDVAQLTDGRTCLVLERLTGGSLARYLVEYPRLSPGEAVTLLAPVAAALDAMHTCGFAHGSLSQATILLDARGRPVLAGFGAVRQLSDTPRQRGPLLRADFTRLGVVMQTLFDALDAPDSRRAGGAALLRRFHASMNPPLDRSDPEPPAATARAGSVLETLERDLFEWADALPLRGFQSITRPDPNTPAAAHSVLAVGTPAQNVDSMRLRQRLLASGDLPGEREPGPETRGRLASDSSTLDRNEPDRSADDSADDWADDWADAPADAPADDLADVVAEGRPGARFGKHGGAFGKFTGRAASVIERLRPRRLLDLALARAVDAPPIHAAGNALRQRLRGRERPILVAALLGVSFVVLALTLFPVAGSAGGAGRTSRFNDTSEAGVRAGATSTPTAPAPAPASAPDNSPVTGDPAAAGGTSASDAPVVEAPNAAAIAGDDPVTAVTALLARRATCLAASSLVCLDGVDQSGSAILARDGYAALDRQRGGSDREIADYAGYLPSLAERSGNLAVVSLTPAQGQEKSQPASVLVVKGEGGWRLREIFDY